MYNILIADDERWMCEGLKKVIEKCAVDFIVTAMARDGLEVLQLLEKEDFDLLITDVRMPEMDGITLLKEMRNRQISIPVIFMSGHDEFQYARAALRYGAIDYVLKPIDKEEIRQILLKIKSQLDAENNGLELTTTTDALALSPEELHQGTQLVQKLKAVVESSYMEELSISRLSEKAGFNSSYLSRIFKLETGKGFVQYLTEVRMTEAKRLLQDPRELTVGMIAKKVGYWDEKHFSKMFKKEVGVSPSEYRKDKLPTR
ncbi:response regulator [Paenibacillus qinlingensis]|uniref:Two-component system response regulator YesN n=1 Tax=Paenibacillus qinlingensis TaxID=1837343 RepID=A0ABU1NTN2_9BACL|nr:response regulator [Paenibacillus qinlingensis]MDR6550840.1 two-component system response regulator YesN [Paenibacillus qinlingensis]